MEVIEVKNIVVSVCAAAVAFGAFAADKQDKDPRETYSTDGWKLSWSEEFDKDGLVDENTWNYEVGFVRNHEPQYYTRARKENCCVKDGVLTITARKEPWQNEFYGKQKSGWKYGIKEAKYTSADITTKRTFLYGRIEIRAQLPNGQGAWPALWTLGDSLRKDPKDPDYWNWPCSGEMDIVEIWGNQPNRVAACFHTSTDGFKQKANEHHKVVGGGDIRCTGEMDPNNGFHTYTLDWYEDKVIIFYDGRQYGKCDLKRADWKDGSNPLRKPHFILMNLALGGYGNGVYDVDTPQMREKKGPDGKVLKDKNGKKIMEPTGKIIPAAKFPMEMKVDWVRYYERAK